ncbi:MAG: serine/threonine-protein kinase [Myxococcota bacterium]
MDSEKPLDHSSSTPLSAVRRDLADGRYILVRKVAEGGTAYVYLGYDTWTETWRAIKTLLPEYAKRPALRHRFEREATTMKTLSHDNIIAVFDAGIDSETVFMVMEFAEGGSVIDWVEANGPMPPRMATDVVLQLCRGIDAAHRQGVIHRDIKPQNLLVDRHGSCKVTDFGIAQVLEDTRMTMTGTVMGTMGYMAPEQNESAKHADERADVYSIAATYYTLIKGEAATHLFMADEQDFDGIPESLAAIIRGGSSYKRENRYQTVREMMGELEGALRLLAPDPLDTPPLIAPDMPNLEDFTPPSFDASVGSQSGGAMVPVGKVQLEEEEPPPPVHRDYVIGVDDVSYEEVGDPQSLEKPTTPQIEMELDRLDRLDRQLEFRRTPPAPARAASPGRHREAIRAVVLVIATVASLGILIVVLTATLSASRIQRLEAEADFYHGRLMRTALEIGQSSIVPLLDNMAMADRMSDGYHDMRQHIFQLGESHDRRGQQTLIRRIQTLADGRVVPSCFRLTLEGGKQGPCITTGHWEDDLDEDIREYDRIQSEISKERATTSGRMAGCAGFD